MRLISSFGFTWNGLKMAWREQPNLRIHFLALAVVVSLGFYFRIQPWEWCSLLVAGAVVISLELINTAIENLTDMVTQERNAIAGKVKDISAAAVMVAAVASVVVGIIIFSKYILSS